MAIRRIRRTAFTTLLLFFVFLVYISSIQEYEQGQDLQLKVPHKFHLHGKEENFPLKKLQSVARTRRTTAPRPTYYINETIYGSMTFREGTQRFNVAPEQFKRMGFPLKNFVEDLTEDVLNSFQFVMGISDNHFDENHALSTVAKVFPNKTVYVYNMGLSNKNLALLNSYCNVKVRNLTFEYYPPHVGVLSTYAFKPVIIHEMLRDFPGVFWIDTSISWRGENLAEWFKIVKNTGGHMVFCSSGHSVYSATHPKMLPYFGVDNDTAKQISAVQAGGQLLYRTKSTYENYFRWYLLCALDPDCIAPLGAHFGCLFGDSDHWTKYADCHRFDQSAASILYHLISGPDKEEYCIPGGHVDVYRGGKAAWPIPICKDNG